MTGIGAIVDAGLCTGCGGCVAALDTPGLAMAFSASGFLRPTDVPLDRNERAKLDRVCAGQRLSHDPQPEDYHPLWGPIRQVATGHATDPEVRFRGSSGGVLSALAIHLVEMAQVDFVLATAADPTDPIGNRTAPRGDRDEVLAAAGSRYAPSAPLADLETHLAAGRRFAFIGKPCDVATLRRMGRHDPRIDRLIPIKLAFFCAGVPSRHGTQAVLAALSVEEAEVERFQYRGDGWPGLTRARRRDGSEASMTYADSWGRILNQHLQFRCKICPDGTGEFADIACADAWVGDDGYPDFAERDGRSLIVARTPAGVALLAGAVASGTIKTEPLAVAEIQAMQPYQAARKRNALARSAALWLASGRGPRFSRLSLFRLTLATSPAVLVRNFVGTFRRAGRGRRT